MSLVFQNSLKNHFILKNKIIQIKSYEQKLKKLIEQKNQQEADNIFVFLLLAKKQLARIS